MSNTTEPTAARTNVWKKSHYYSVPLVEKIKMRVGDVEAKFVVSASFHRATQKLHLSVTTEERVDYTVNHWFFLPGTNKPDNDSKLTQNRPKSARSWRVLDPSNNPLILELEFKKIEHRRSYPLPEDVTKSYIERGPMIMLIGSDGRVSVPRRALEMRSETFENMFKYDSKEKRTGEIEMKDVDEKTLNAFSYFLATGQIKGGKETALGLILFSDKYDIQDMKKAAEKFVKRNFKEMDKEDILDVFNKVGRESLKRALEKAWVKKRKTL